VQAALSRHPCTPKTPLSRLYGPWSRNEQTKMRPVAVLNHRARYQAEPACFGHSFVTGRTGATLEASRAPPMAMRGRPTVNMLKLRH
jgi:hypothetical protein